MSHIAKFLVRPRPFKNEASIGYLSRVARLNGFDNHRRMSTAIRDDSHNDAQAIFDLLHLSCEDRGYLFGPWPSYVGQSSSMLGLRPCDFNHMAVRWCVHCIAEESYVRGIWSLKLCSACAIHHVMLQDCCPVCGGRQHPEYYGIKYCSCGASLLGIPPVSAPAPLVKMQAAFGTALLGGTDKDHFGLPMLQPSAWHRLICYLGQFTESSQPSRPGQIAGLHRLDVAALVMLNCAHLLEKWPDNFHRLLAALQNQQPKNTSLRNTFGRLYRVLYVDLHDECFGFLREAFEQFVAKNWWGLVCKRNRLFNPKTYSTHPRLSITKAASRSGTTPATVRKLVQAELIESSISVLSSGRKATTVHHKELSRLLAIADDSMTLIQAAHFLGLSKSRTRELITSNTIKPIVGRLSNTGSAWMLSKRELQAIVAVPNKEVGELQIVTLRQILKQWRLRCGEFSKLICAVTNRELVPITPNSTNVKLGDYGFVRSEVKNWLNDQRPNELLSINDAAIALGIKQQVAYDLVKYNLLLVTHSSLGRRVSRNALDIFSKKYIALSALARELGQSPKSLFRKISARPVCGPSINGARQYFYLRTEIENTLTMWAPSKNTK